MNYLGHFILNHEVCNAALRPYFVAGVALPDLWTRYSRKKRLHWPSVLAADPDTRDAADLRCGLLNHVAVDKRFHLSPTFLRWLRAVRAHAPEAERGAIVVDFAAHVAIELTLDHKLALRRPDRAEQFYDTLLACDPQRLADTAGSLGRVDTAGLAREVSDFVRRRFVPHFARRETIAAVLHYVLSLSRVRPLPTDQTQQRLIAAALEIVDPDALWPELTRSPESLPAPTSPRAATGART